jgi:hypothetical protein
MIYVLEMESEIFIYCLFTLLANSTFALEVPFLSGRIIDEAGILDTETKELLEEKLKAHEKENNKPNSSFNYTFFGKRSIRRIFFKSCEHLEARTKEKG